MATVTSPFGFRPHILKHLVCHHVGFFGARVDHIWTRGWSAKLSANATKLGYQSASINWTRLCAGTDIYKLKISKRLEVS